MRKKYLRMMFVILVLLWVGVLLSNDVQASTVSQDKLYRLALIKGVKRCYKLYAKNRVTTENYTDYLSVFDTNGSFSKDSSSDVWITTHVGNTQNSDSNKKDSDMSCKQVFEGYGGTMKGIKSYYSALGSADLPTMGYELVGVVASERSEDELYNSDETASITLSSNNIQNGNDNFRESLTVEGNGIECTGKRKEQKKFFGGVEYVWSNIDCNGEIVIKKKEDVLFSLVVNNGIFSVTTNGVSVPYDGDILGMQMMNYASQNEITLADAIKGSAFNSDLVADVNAVLETLGYSSPTTVFDYNASVVNNTAEQENKEYKPKNGVKLDAAKAMLGNIGVDSAEIDYNWTPDDKYALYYYYLRDVMKDYPDIRINECNEEKPDGWVFKNTATQWCRIQIPSNSEAALKKVYSVMTAAALREGTFKQVLEWFKKDSSYKGMSDDAYAGAYVNADGEMTDPSEEEGVCYANSGPIGWLICPIIDGISKIGEKLWGVVETDFLQVQAGELFKNDGGLEKTWGIFRNVANVVFIILFLFVIFSQLTGVGIDNYGIKKILPKLIVVAILINLSFLICALLVDLSNILGSGLNQLFSEIAKTIPVETVEVGLGQTLAIAGLVGGGGVLFGILAGPMGLIGAGLSVLSIALTLVISMFFLFLVLMVRNAGVVILIAIAPVAIVCYMLPNTEKLFKKWVDLLKAVLVVYPICGLMVGAGKMAGRLLASTGNEGMAIAGMVVEVIPFFLIPMMLRQSLQLMGNIGARLQNAGQRVGRGASQRTTGAIRNSERFKDWSQFQTKFRSDRAGAKRALSLQQKLERRKVANGGKLSEKDNERLLKATETVNAYEQRRAQGQFGAYKLDRETAERRAAASLNAQEQKAALEEFAGMNDTDFAAQVASVNSSDSWYKTGDRVAEQRMAALLQTMENRGMESQVFDVLRNNNVSGSSTVMQTLAGSRNYMMQAYGKKGVGKDFTTFETDGTLQKYTQDNDIKNADKDSLAEINAHASQTTTMDPKTKVPVVSDTVSQDMVMDAAVNTQTPKVRAQMNDMIASKLTNSDNLSADLTKYNLKGDSFRTMNGDTAQAMLRGVTDNLMTKGGYTNRASAEVAAKWLLNKTFTNQINQARTNDQINSKISHGPGTVGDIFGI